MVVGYQKRAKGTIKVALQKGWNVDSGLHDFLTNDAELVGFSKREKCKDQGYSQNPGS